MLSLFFGKIEADVMGSARVYFYITSALFPFIAAFNASAALFRSMGNAKVPMKNALVMNVLNLIGNSIFIYGMGWGAFGAGLATLISRASAATLIMIMLRKPQLPISVRSYRFWKIHWAMVRKILSIGIPNGL
jgi:Na+-driven multidrug efflux pump